MQLESSRLLLRSPTVQDVDDYMEFCNSDFVLRYNAMREKTREEIASEFSGGGTEWGPFVLEHKETEKVIGIVFTEEDSMRWGVSSRELSYFISEPYARQGYMKEALSVIISYLFSNNMLDCIAARSFAPNIASRRLLASLGFHQDGLIPQCVKGFGDVIFDDTLHSLLRTEFLLQSSVK